MSNCSGKLLLPKAALVTELALSLPPPEGGPGDEVLGVLGVGEARAALRNATGQTHMTGILTGTATW
eukprot:SAG31_NODE_32149_length_359_cov_0.992308_1_plen_66_part_10